MDHRSPACELAKNKRAPVKRRLVYSTDHRQLNIAFQEVWTGDITRRGNSQVTRHMGSMCMQNSQSSMSASYCIY